MAKAIDNFMLAIVPLVGSTITAASSYYILDMIDFPDAALFAMIVFVLAMLKNWGGDSTDAF